MKHIGIFLFVLVAFLSVACENKVSHKPSPELPDSDQEPVQDEDQTAPDEDTQQGVLKVTANENNTLSCRLSFKTSEPVKTYVKYYSDNHAGYRITEDKASKDHYFFLWGMRENRDYKIEVYYENDELLDRAEFHSGYVPGDIKPVRLVAKDAENVAPGFVLMAPSARDYNDYRVPPLLLMIDSDGYYVWYFEYHPELEITLGDGRYIPETKTIFAGIIKLTSLAEVPFEEGLEIDLEGRVVWKSPELKNYSYAENGWHHEYKKLDDGSILFLQAQYQDKLVTDKIVNVDSNYNEIWSWSYLEEPDLFDPGECVEYGEWCDWTHTNTVIMEKDTGAVYFNSRYLGFYKMDMDSREILWKFAPGGDFNFVGNDPDPWPEGAHSPRFNEAHDRLLIYDNGFPSRGYSRVIEYAFDEVNRNFDISFKFDGSELGRTWFAGGWGSVYPLENGNILVTKGDPIDLEENSSIFEINREGRVVWEIYMEELESGKMEVYSAEKFVPDLEPLND
ncbi:aryl-sulfate sulfotransferase [bacterium]|nr:aryl-sulfate sulfotransferase [bacterium]